MSKITTAPATLVNSETVTDRPGLRVVRMELPPGEALPTHLAPRDVLIVVVSGSGRVTLDDKVIEVEPGSVVDLAPGQRHGIEAVERLKFVLVQAALADELPAPQIETPVARLETFQADKQQPPLKIVSLNRSVA